MSGVVRGFDCKPCNSCQWSFIKLDELAHHLRGKAASSMMVHALEIY